jgi:hypothetical protein
MRFMTIIGLLLVAAIVVTAGCGESKQDKALSDICSARDDIKSEVDKLQGLTLTTATTSEVKGSLQKIQDDLSKIADKSGDLSQDRRKEIQDANNTFTSKAKETLSKVGTSVSIQDAGKQLNAAFDQLAESYKGSLGQVDCS